MKTLGFNYPGFNLNDKISFIFFVPGGILNNYTYKLSDEKQVYFLIYPLQPNNKG